VSPPSLLMRFWRCVGARGPRFYFRFRSTGRTVAFSVAHSLPNVAATRCKLRCKLARRRGAKEGETGRMPDMKNQRDMVKLLIS
jgi:hypothetical protein